MRNRLSDESINVIKNLYDQGVDIKTIAKSFGLDINTVRYHVDPVGKKEKQGQYIKQLVNNHRYCDIVDVVGKYLDSIR